MAEVLEWLRVMDNMQNAAIIVIGVILILHMVTGARR
jgi:hypothetical protein